MSQSPRNRNFIFRVAVPVPLYRLFDYLPPHGINPLSVRPGTRLLVPFGRRKAKLTAFLIKVTDECDTDISSLKFIDQILDDEPLLRQKDLELLLWASRYYHHPPGEVVSAAFPVMLRKGKAAVCKRENLYELTDLGKKIDLSELKKAPRQAELLGKMRNLGRQASTADLKDFNSNWRQPGKELINKRLLRIVDYDNAQNTTTLATVNDEGITPNQQQRKAISAVSESLDQFSVFLLEGVTGSGKTEVYMQIIRQVLQLDRQVIILLPEITLTPQLEERFRKRFTVPIAVSHSSLTDTERLNAWLSMQRGECSILLGTRSALFTPLKRPGLIILDEEHDSSFKQQEGFRFSARDVAIVRARSLQIPIVLGSATPSLESLYNVRRKRYQPLLLSERAGGALEPDLSIMDIRGKLMQEGLCASLITEIKKTLGRNEQILLFLNRRGYAPTLICHSCGWVARCDRCDTNLVIHYDSGILRCHHCGKEQPHVNNCPSCQSQELTALGQGTERVEKVLAQLFPNEIVIRLDRDTTKRKGALHQMLEDIRNGTARIILGTQMLAKGHHFPNVTLVAILDVDSGLFSIDYHSPEKLAQMIVQVAGRAGRAEKPGKVILQTRHPDHPLLVSLINQGYQHFSKTALEERKAAMLPPFSHQALLRVVSVNRSAPVEFLEEIRSIIHAEAHSGGTQILGPVPSPMARKAGQFRFQMLFQSDQRKNLHALLKKLVPRIEKIKASKKVRWSLDVDPVDLY